MFAKQAMLANGVRFPDTIGIGIYPVDAHMAACDTTLPGDDVVLLLVLLFRFVFCCLLCCLWCLLPHPLNVLAPDYIHDSSIQPYFLPFRALTVQALDNVLVCGKVGWLFGCS